MDALVKTAFSVPKPLARYVAPAARQIAEARPRTLYMTLSRLPKDGVGMRVHQERWTAKGIDGCYWEVKRVKLKCEGKHGKAWGRLVWRGRPISTRDEEIRGGLKYKWETGHSTGTKLPAKQHDLLDQIALKTPGKPQFPETEEQRRAREKEIFDQAIQSAVNDLVLRPAARK